MSPGTAALLRSDVTSSSDQPAGSVVTDRIESFTEQGLLLASGRQLEADVVITATAEHEGDGGMAIAVDGTAVDVSKTVATRESCSACAELP